MKKKILILLGILIAFYAVFSMLDTSEYRVEKRLWRMRKRFAAAVQDPKAVPAAQFENIVKDYRKLIQRFPDSKYVPQMYSEIAGLYLVAQKYEDARGAYSEVISKFSGHDHVVSKAMVDIGSSYLTEGKFDQGIEVFQHVWKDYSRTEAGFMMPLYIAGIYRSARRAADMRDALENAAAFYKGIADNDAEVGFLRLNAYQMLATTYMAQEKWEQALSVLRTLLYEFADSDLITVQRIRIITRMINVTAAVRMQDYNRAVVLYQDFMREHPGHKLNPLLEKVIESLNYLNTQQGQAVFSQQ